MSTARSAFTEAIEDHLALKKQNSALESAMPLARYDVGDPLERYPGGPNRAVETPELASEAPAVATPEPALDSTQLLVGPSPEQAMEAATALEHGFASSPFEPLNGMAPMLSLVEDVEEEPAPQPQEHDHVAAPAQAEVLRFPGGAGPREVLAPTPAGDDLIFVSDDTQLEIDVHSMTQAMPSPAFESAAYDADEDLEATGEQPVLVIDTDEPFAASEYSEPREPARRSKPRFFGIGRKRRDDVQQADGWFTDGPRDFNWD